MATPYFQDLALDHVEFYVSDLSDKVARLSETYGFDVYARSGFPSDRASHVRSAALGADQVRIVLSEAQTQDHPGAAYIRAHGDGVADIALRTEDAQAAVAEATRRGARPIAGPTERDGIVTASIAGFGDMVHTFVQRPAGADPRLLPSFGTPDAVGKPAATGLSAVDHFAVCVEAGQLGSTVSFYVEVLDFRDIYSERITVGSQAMNSRVVQSRSGDITFTIIEPDTALAPGQIDDFLKNHDGAGVQHVALTSPNIASSVRALAERGVEFLDTPDSYYQLLRDRLTLSSHSVEDLRSLDILVDEDHDGQLFQIFTRSAHPRRTFFFEIIERHGATTFGSGNIKALYEAVELETSKVSG